MKKITLLIILVFVYSLLTYSQEEQIVSIASSKMNVLYVGVDNPMTIAASGINAKDIQVTISQGSIKKTKSGTYITRVRKRGLVDISVSAGGKIISTQTFRCKYVPDPIAVVGANRKNKRGGVMSKNELLANVGVHAVIENFSFDIKFVVVSFDVTTMDNGFLVLGRSTSAKFTNQQKSLIRNANIGSRVVIDNVKARGPDGIIRDLNSIVFKLK